MLVAFLGMHVPLLALIFYFTLSSPSGLELTLHILVITLLATLVGTAVTLYLLYALLAPVSLASCRVREYITDKKMPDLPTHFTDEAGRLMADVKYTVKHLDELIRSLERTSKTDYLTGVYNRHAGEKRLREDIARAQRGEDTMVLAMLDFDHLKLINDRYGHETGDICLRHVVKIIKSHIREGDWLARWGGDEFIMVLWNAKEELSAKIPERICLALKENPVRTPGGDEINLTLSAGVCEYNGKDDAQTLFVKADGALLQAKRGGRGQIVYYTASAPPLSP